MKEEEEVVVVDEWKAGGILSVWFFVGRTSRPSFSLSLFIPSLSHELPFCAHPLPSPPRRHPYRPAIAHGMAPFSVSECNVM